MYLFCCDEVLTLNYRWIIKCVLRVFTHVVCILSVAIFCHICSFAYWCALWDMGHFKEFVLQNYMSMENKLAESASVSSTTFRTFNLRFRSQGFSFAL